MAESTVIAILGASNNPERYAHKALTMLREYGYHAVPVHPAFNEIDGTKVAHSMGEIQEPVDTLTLYVNPARVAAMLDQIVALRPRRVIFNPGTESPDARARLESEGIRCVEACTLVLLRTGQFGKA